MSDKLLGFPPPPEPAIPATASPAQQAAARVNGARSAGNGTRHGLRGDPFALLPGEDREELTAVIADWRPRDAYERRWVMDLVTAMWRQDRLHGLEIAALTAAAAESPPTEASLRKLLTFARYGARIDRDIGRALQALRVLRNRPDAEVEESQNGTSEPGQPEPTPRNFTNDLSPRTPEPGPATPLNRQQRRRLEALTRKRRAA